MTTTDKTDEWMSFPDVHRKGYDAGRLRAEQDAAAEELGEMVGILTPSVIEALGKAFDESGEFDPCLGCNMNLKRSFQQGFIEGWLEESAAARGYGRL